MAEHACEDLFCKGCDAEVRKRNHFLETEVRELTTRLNRKAELQGKLDKALQDIYELRKKLEHQDELLYLYRTSQTASKALDLAETMLENGRRYKRQRGEM